MRSGWKQHAPLPVRSTEEAMRRSCAPLLADRFGWTSRDRVIAAVYQEKFDLASVAPVVLSAAAEGDPAALHILEDRRHAAR